MLVSGESDFQRTFVDGLFSFQGANLFEVGIFAGSVLLLVVSVQGANLLEVWTGGRFGLRSVGLR